MFIRIPLLLRSLCVSSAETNQLGNDFDFDNTFFFFPLFIYIILIFFVFLILMLKQCFYCYNYIYIYMKGMENTSSLFFGDRK